MWEVGVASIENPGTQSADRRFVASAMALPLLEPDQEFSLARRWRQQGDEAALHQLTTAYLRLVVATAVRFRNYGLPVGDLIQEGTIGLMQAAARFEPDRQVRFSTYAGWWIRSAIQDHVLRNWSIVRIGTTASQKALFFNLRRLRARLNQGNGTMSPDDRQAVATALRVRNDEVEMMDLRLGTGDRSLNAALGDTGDDVWQDLLADDRPLPDEVVADRRDGRVRRAWLGRALQALSPRELTVIRERRLSEPSVTLEALGTRLGVSKERVRQIEHNALKKLKASLTREAPDPRGAGLVPA